MKTIEIVPALTDAEIATAIVSAKSLGYTHATCVVNGDAIPQLLSLDEVPTLRGQTVSLTLGVKLKGLPFEDRPLTEGESADVASPAKAKRTRKEATPKAKKPTAKAKIAARKSPAKKPVGPKVVIPAGTAVRKDTGFISLVDELLLSTTGEKVEGFQRSKFTVDQALAKVMAKFPDKDPVSVKKIIKVRPRHLERRKGDEYNDKSKRAPRWGFVGPGTNATVTEIDQMLADKLTAEQIAERLVRLHGRDPKHAKRMVAARLKFCAKRDAELAKKESKAS